MLRVSIVLLIGFLLVTFYYMFIHENLVEKRNAERTYTPMYDISYELPNDYEPLRHLKQEVSSKDAYSPENTEISYIFELRPIKKFTSIRVMTTEGEILEEIFFNDKKETSDGHEQLYIRLTPDIQLTSNRSFEVIPHGIKDKEYTTEDFKKTLPNDTDDTQNTKRSESDVSDDEETTDNYQEKKEESDNNDGVVIEEVEEPNEIEDVTLP